MVSTWASHARVGVRRHSLGAYTAVDRYRPVQRPLHVWTRGAKERRRGKGEPVAEGPKLIGPTNADSLASDRRIWFRGSSLRQCVGRGQVPPPPGWRLIPGPRFAAALGGFRGRLRRRRAPRHARLGYLPLVSLLRSLWCRNIIPILKLVTRRGKL